MNAVALLFRRLWYLLNRRRFERELEAEMAAHRETMGDRGGGPGFGSTLRLREESRDAWGWTWLDDGLRDLWHAARSLVQTPGFMVTGLVILSLGIGLNLAFFQMINVMLLRPLPVRDPHRLVRLFLRHPEGMSSHVPYAATQFMRRHNNVLTAVLTEATSDVTWGEDAAERIPAAYVSANWFDELGYGPALGRMFAEELDERPDAQPAAVVSHRLWITRLGADPDIAGKTIRLNGRPVTVCGVARADFPGLDQTRAIEVWLPVRQIAYLQPGTDFLENWKSNNTALFGRLRPGISPQAASEAIRATTMRALADERPEAFTPKHWLEPHSGSLHFSPPSSLREERTASALLLGLSGLVMLVAAANLASLTLCRALGRVREIGIRTALGASRARVLRHLAAESMLLSLGGAAGGVLVGWAAARAAADLTGLPAHLDFTPDWRTAAAALIAACAAMVTAGVLPAWQVSRRDLSVSIRDGGQQASTALARTRLRAVLVGAQVAGSCVVLALAGMAVRGLREVTKADPGFSYERVAVLDPMLWRYGIKPAGARAFWDEVKSQVAVHPETAAFALVSPVPLGRGLNQGDYRDAPFLSVTQMWVEPSFFDAMRVKILVGRTFTAADPPRTTTIISRKLALAMYGELNVVGREFPKSGKGERSLIVGVSDDAQMFKVGLSNMAERYLPADPLRLDGYGLIVRAREDPAALVTPLRALARKADSRLLADARLMRADFSGKMRQPRLASAIGAGLGLLTLGLAALGIYGMVSQWAAMRRKEIGIRMALGAGHGSIARSLVGRMAWPVVAGLILGLAATAPVSRTFEAILPFAFVRDWAGPTLAACLLLGAGVLAAGMPTLSALRTNPLAALRQD